MLSDFLSFASVSNNPHPALHMSSGGFQREVRSESWVTRTRSIIHPFTCVTLYHGSWLPASALAPRSGRFDALPSSLS